jgi:hypothetical protein
MAIYRMLRTASFSPEDVERLAAAYEDALQTLHIVNRADPITVQSPAVSPAEPMTVMVTVT